MTAAEMDKIMTDDVYAVLTKDGKVIEEIKISIILSLVLRKSQFINQMALNEIYNDVNAFITRAGLEQLEDISMLLPLMPEQKRLPQTADDINAAFTGDGMEKKVIDDHLS